MFYDITVIGSGMGSLTAAALLANRGLKVQIIEQNWLPGGCTSSYWRKGFVFESGATTLVGMDPGMPLRYLLNEIKLDIPMRRLELPMQVHMANGDIINKYNDIEKWIAESSRYFGGDQKGFWRKAYKLSKFVWSASTKYQTFPPARARDYLGLLTNFSLTDIPGALNAFQSTKNVMTKHEVRSEAFDAYVNEQLLITAQNHMEEVNFLFGSASLCYTNYGNYYVDGGLINLVNPLIQFIESKGGQITYRDAVESIHYDKSKQYTIKTRKGEYHSRYVISGIPVNNTVQIYEEAKKQVKSKKLLESKKLNSAFQMGLGFKTHRDYESLHHQIHLSEPLPETGSKSIFISLSHPEDSTRSDKAGYTVASVSTHLPDPEKRIIDPEKAEAAVIKELERRDFLKSENIEYYHSSSPKSWMKWTGRKWGFVGGYPQFMKTKPWEMIESRLDDHGAYLVGDTAYPGQGIPGTTLSGIVAARKLINDWKV
jgi:phytoene dehydrogenase-like protein